MTNIPEQSNSYFEDEMYYLFYHSSDLDDDMSGQLTQNN